MILKQRNCALRQAAWIHVADETLLLMHPPRSLNIFLFRSTVDFDADETCHDRKLRRRKAVNMLFLTTAVKMDAATSQ